MKLWHIKITIRNAFQIFSFWFKRQEEKGWVLVSWKFHKGKGKKKGNMMMMWTNGRVERISADTHVHGTWSNLTQTHTPTVPYNYSNSLQRSYFTDKLTTVIFFFKPIYTVRFSSNGHKIQFSKLFLRRTLFNKPSFFFIPMLR